MYRIADPAIRKIFLHGRQAGAIRRIQAFFKADGRLGSLEIHLFGEMHDKSNRGRDGIMLVGAADKFLGPGKYHVVGLYLGGTGFGDLFSQDTWRAGGGG